MQFGIPMVLQKSSNENNKKPQIPKYNANSEQYSDYISRVLFKETDAPIRKASRAYSSKASTLRIKTVEDKRAFFSTIHSDNKKAFKQITHFKDFKMLLKKGQNTIELYARPYTSRIKDINPSILLHPKFHMQMPSIAAESSIHSRVRRRSLMERRNTVESKEENKKTIARTVRIYSRRCSTALIR